MKWFARTGVVSIILGLSLFACSTKAGVAPYAQTFTQTRISSAAASQSILFVSSAKENVIDEYDAAPPNRFIRSITNGLTGPNGQAVDSAGDLFVANADGRNLAVFAPPFQKPSLVYTKDLTNPVTPAIASNGTLYVSNFHSDGSGEVYAFAAHKLSPSLTIPIEAEGLAVDLKNYLYASVQIGSPSSGHILKFAPNSIKGKDLGISLSFAGRLAIDPNGNIIACDQTAPAVDVFHPGETRPYRRITSGVFDPFAVALDRSATHLYVADGIGKTIRVYSYPALKLVNTIQRTTAAFGLSVSPPAPL